MTRNVIGSPSHIKKMIQDIYLDLHKSTKCATVNTERMTAVSLLQSNILGDLE